MITIQVHTLGNGTPEIAVVGSVHGDEACGKEAIEQFVSDDPDVQRPVKLIVANEEALAADVRYTDTDLNRAFPGDADSDMYEERLAAKLVEALQGLRVLDLHATKSYDEPFAIIPELTPTTADLIQATGVDHAVDMSAFSGNDLIGHCGGILVECGPLGTEQAAEQAYQVVRNFLAAHGVIDETVERTDPPVFRGAEKVEKPEAYDLLVDNFERVDAGQAYAENDHDVKTADRPFYPVLMSETGYQDILGFRAERVGRLSEIREDQR